jgi:hypothetical protein
MEKWQRLLGNAIIMGLIVFFSTLSINYPPTMQNLWAAFIGSMLALLPALQLIFKGNGGSPTPVADSTESASGGDNPPVLGWLL